MIAQQPTLDVSPVRINHCYIVQSRAYVAPYRAIDLAFTNEGAAPADEVHFSVTYAKRVEHLVDKGTFSPHVRIAHSFAGFFNALYRRPIADSCTVDYVHFTDGRSWQRGHNLQ